MWSLAMNSSICFLRSAERGICGWKKEEIQFVRNDICNRRFAIGTRPRNILGLDFDVPIPFAKCRLVVRRLFICLFGSSDRVVGDVYASSISTTAVSRYILSGPSISFTGSVFSVFIVLRISRYTGLCVPCCVFDVHRFNDFLFYQLCVPCCVFCRFCCTHPPCLTILTTTD